MNMFGISLEQKPKAVLEPMISAEPNYDEMEMKIISTDCNLSQETIESTKLVLQNFLTSALPQTLARVFEAQKLQEVQRQAILKNVEEANTKMVDHLVAILDERLSSDRKSLIAHKKKVLHYLNITRETVAQVATNIFTFD